MSIKINTSDSFDVTYNSGGNCRVVPSSEVWDVISCWPSSYSLPVSPHSSPGVLYESADSYKVFVPAFGFLPEGLEVNINPWAITVKGTATFVPGDGFVKTFGTPPSTVIESYFYTSHLTDPETASADLKDGILTISVKKASASRTVKVKVK
jgi:HSP20 family molecular chaperone IbpA